MMETRLCDAPDAAVEQAADAHPLVDALRREGAQQLDPVRFHYVAVLAQRAGVHEGSVRRILDGKLDAAAAAFRKRLAQSHGAAQDTASAAAPVHRETLGDLVRHMAEHSLGKSDAGATAPIAPRTELKSVVYFRNTWSKLSAEKQLTQALGQAPKNAGPINSHVVALRALALMRDTSPDYLNRFTSYVDALIRLDQGKTTAPLYVKTARKPARPAAKRRATR